MLLGHTYPSLDTLLLSNCELTGEDLGSVPLATVNRRLPKLKHFDISSNELWHQARSFFNNECKWEHLTSIDVTDDSMGLNPNMTEFILELIKHLSMGYLQSLQQFTFTNNARNPRKWEFLAKCEQLQTIQIMRFDPMSNSAIVSTLQEGMLLALRNLCICSFHKKVLLRECKRHRSTIHRVSSARYAIPGPGGGTPSQVWGGGTRSQVWGEVPHPRSEGVPIPGLGGYPIPGLVGYPIPGLGGTPSQVWLGGCTLCTPLT